ncbi:MAG: phosphatase PAP2 family protein [Oscillospiraceae bacterium]|jgi:undecaprenyl-diphosphatase|nr:phosphatase PAP2 family protein [Oscillospiraceae bacterium]
MLAQLQALDERILLFIQRVFKCAFLDAVMPPVTYLAESGALWIIAALAILIFYRRRVSMYERPRLVLGGKRLSPQTDEPTYPGRLLGLMLGGALIIGLLVGNLILKNVFARVRPYEVLEPVGGLLIARQHDFSFPSGHTLHSFAGATVLFYLNRKLGIAAFILAALIAFSRLYLFVHWPSDILGGIIVGVLSAIAAINLFRAIVRKAANQKKNDSAPL